MVFLFRQAADFLSLLFSAAGLAHSIVAPVDAPHRPRKTKRVARGRFLLPVEWQRVKQVLDRHPLPKARAYFHLLILEGPRRSEAQRMEWAHLDLAEGLWYKPMTKNGRSQTLALSPQTCQIIDALPREGRYVFPGESLQAPWSHTAIEHAWRKIRRQAGVENVQIRDLRRTCASWMTMQGSPLSVVQSVLHHSSLQVTQVYARLDQRTVREALTRHGEKVMGMGDLAPAGRPGRHT